MATNRTTARQHNHGSVDGMIAVFGGNQGTSKCNFSATSGPTGSADGAAGYTYGSLWYDVSAKRIYICENPVNGSAVWKSLGTVSIGQLSTTGTATSSTFLRGDGSWSNTLAGPISIATSLTFTGTSGVISPTSSDGADASGLVLTGYGGSLFSPTRGASFYLTGNESIDLSGTIQGCAIIQIGGASSSKFYIAGSTSTTILFGVDPNLTTVGTANGLYFSGTGSITAGNRQIGGTSGGIQINTPTGTALYGTVAGSQLYRVNASNAAFGYQAGNAIFGSSGTQSTFMGYAAGLNVTTGSYMTGIGAYAFGSGISTGANYGVAFGYQAGYNTTSGTAGIYIGYAAGAALTTPSNNIAIGQAVMANSATQPGDGNIAIGVNAARYLAGSAANGVYIGASAGGSSSGVTGTRNTFVGYNSGGGNTSGGYNTFIGAIAGLNNTTESYNTAVGYAALGRTGVAGTGSNLSAFGLYSLGSNTSGVQNASFGSYSLYTNTTGSYCAAFGYEAGYNNTSGSYSTFIGSQAGKAVTTGSGNMLFGYCAGKDITTGSYNLIMGHNIAADSATGDYQVNISNLLLRNTSGHITLNYGAIGSTLPMYSMTGQVTKQNVYGVTYANGSTTAILTLANTAGRIEFFDDQGEEAVVRYDGTSAYLEQHSAEWGWTTTPAAGSIGLEVVGGVLNMYLGSSATRKIGWFIRNVSFA